VVRGCLLYNFSCSLYLTITQKDLLCIDEISSTTTAEAKTVAMSSAEFQEWVEPCISRNLKGHSEVRNPLSQNVQLLTSQPELRPSDPSSECALQDRPAEHPGAPSGCAQPHANAANAPHQALGQTDGSGEARSLNKRRSGLLRALRGTGVSGNEVGSRDASREEMVETIVGAVDPVVLSHHPTMSSVGPTAPRPSLLERINPPAFMIDVLSWTSQDPRQSLLFNSWGIIYRIHACIINIPCAHIVLIHLPQTDTDPQGRSTTTVWRAKRAKLGNTEDRVAKVEWAPGGGLGRVAFKKVRPFLQRVSHLTTYNLISLQNIVVPMTDLVRQDPRVPVGFSFVSNNINSCLT